MKKIIMAASVISLVLSGCYDKTETEDRRYVVLMGIDSGRNEEFITSKYDVVGNNGKYFLTVGEAKLENDIGKESEDFGHYAGVTVCGYGGFFGRSEENRVSPLCRHGPGRGTFRGAGHFYRAFCGNVLRREEIGKGRRTMSKHMRPVYDERDDEIDAHSKSRAWDFVVVCIEVFTILCVVKGNTAWIGCLALLFAGMAANMMYRFDEYEERAYFHGGLILGAIGLALLIWFGVCG